MLELSAPDYDSIRLGIQTTGVPVNVDVWKSSNIRAIDQGEEAAQWFSDWLGAEVRLVHIADGYIRRVSPEYAVQADDHTGFADGYPILLASEEGLQDLNSRLDTPVPMNRFRPNLVVKGGEPFAEDTWNRIRAGDVELAVVKPCARCVVTTIDKNTLAASKEPLKTLGKYRKHQPLPDDRTACHSNESRADPVKSRQDSQRPPGQFKSLSIAPGREPGTGRWHRL